MGNSRDYGLIVKVSADTAWPFTVITEIRPEVAPLAPISETLRVIVDAVVDAGVTVLLRQSFTTNPLAPKPLPLIVSVPPAPIEMVSVDSDVIEGGAVVSMAKAVAPFKVTEAPLPGALLGWLGV